MQPISSKMDDLGPRSGSQYTLLQSVEFWAEVCSNTTIITFFANLWARCIHSHPIEVSGVVPQIELNFAQAKRQGHEKPGIAALSATWTP